MNMPLETGDLAAALEATASVQPEVMPTADILQQERLGVEGANAKGSQPEQNKSVTEPAKRGRGRPPKDATVSTAKPKSTVGGVKTVQDETALMETAQRQELAKQVITLVEQSGTMLAGNAAIMQEGEKLALTANLDNYMKQKNINDIPAGLMLTIGISMYYGRVVATPVGDEKIPLFVRWGYKVKNWYYKVRGKHYAQPDKWSDGQRKDDTSKNAGTDAKGSRNQ